MKLKYKLLLAILIASIIPLAMVSLYTLKKVEKAFTENQFNVLRSVYNEKSSGVSSYFNKIVLQIKDMAHTEETIKAMEAFAAGFEGINKGNMFASEAEVSASVATHRASVSDFYKNQFHSQFDESNKAKVNPVSLLPKSDSGMKLQSLYLANNPNPLNNKQALEHANDSSRYSNYHAQYHKIFNRFLETYGFYDIFLVEPESGYIVYSVYKEIDFATSLLTGPHAKSGLGQAYRAAIKQQSDFKPHLVDYASYLPSYNAPASFISQPIVKDGSIIGVLIFQMPLNQINQVTNSMASLGETGKAYVLGGNDDLLRSQLRHIDESTVLTPAPNIEEIRAALERDGHSTYSDYRDQEVESIVGIVEILGHQWRMVVQQDTKEAFKELGVIKKSYFSAFVMGLVVAIFVALLLLRNIRRQLGAEPDFLNEIAREIAEGNLTRDFSDLTAPSGTFQTMVSMQQTLKKRDSLDRETMTKISRLRDGLQKLTTPVVLADSDHRITFVNVAMEDTINEFHSDFCEAISSFDHANILQSSITLFSDNPMDLQARIESLSGEYGCEFIAGSRIFKLIFNAIHSDTGERIGTSLEWQDITAERRVMDEVDAVVSSANRGDLSVRVEECDKQDTYLGLSQGINGLLENNQKFVGDVNDFLSAISAGNLTKTIDTDYQGAFAEIKRDANLTVAKLMEVVLDIRTAAGTVNTASGEINSGNLDLSRRTAQAAVSLEETSSSMAEMTKSVAKNAESSKKAKELALSAMGYADKGGEVVGEAVVAMNEINDSSSEISHIIGVIDDIAFQTNLLALNASVEAARAGEQGRGFAVVASEVRNLAGRSATAAKEIKELIEVSVSRVSNGTELVNESGKTLQHIVAEVNRVTDMVSEISESSHAQSEGIDLVNKTIAQLDDATQSNAALVDEASAASQSASEQAASLIRMIDFFSTSSPSHLAAEGTKLTVVK